MADIESERRRADAAERELAAQGFVLEKALVLLHQAWELLDEHQQAHGSVETRRAMAERHGTPIDVDGPEQRWRIRRDAFLAVDPDA